MCGIGVCIEQTLINYQVKEPVAYAMLAYINMRNKSREFSTRIDQLDPSVMIREQIIYYVRKHDIKPSETSILKMQMLDNLSSGIVMSC